MPTATLQTNRGAITIEFCPDVAPNTVESFMKLARKGFYDGLTFHRIIKGFMMQGGCPKGDGTGGPGYSIDAEFSDRPHTFGSVSMARSRDPNSAGSQFFICFKEAAHLDGQYTLFGQVTEGAEVVREIERTAVTDSNDRPRQAVKIDKVTIQEDPK